jgi:parvulin-like peptidyl-prolyl isomerase
MPSGKVVGGSRDAEDAGAPGKSFEFGGLVTAEQDTPCAGRYHHTFAKLERPHPGRGRKGMMSRQPQLQNLPGTLGLTLAVGAVFIGSASAREIIDGVAAQVGGEVVLVSEVEEMAKPMDKRMLDQGAGQGDLLVMRSEVLERLIEQKLLSDMVRRLELNVSDEEVSTAIAGIANDSDITVGQLLRSVTAHGMTQIEYRDKLKGEIERSKVVSGMVRSKVKVTKEEVEQLFRDRFSNQSRGGKEVRLRHILVGYGERMLRDKDTACGIAAFGKKRIADGEISFPALAREISDVNGERGGEMGWLHADDIAGWMAPAIRNLQGGNVSEVIVMPFGCNLLEVVGRRDFEPMTFEQAAPALENEIFNRKTEQEFVKWIDEVRGQTYIERKGKYAEGSRLIQGANPERADRPDDL